MPIDFAGLVATFGVPGGVLAVAVIVVWRLYIKALDDKDKAVASAAAAKDQTILRLEEENKDLKGRIFRVLDKAELVADLAGAPDPQNPPAPPRRRRQEV